MTGADAAATTVAQPAPPVVKPAAPREGLLIVSDTQTGPRIYPSLHVACENAKDGDVIELHYSGRRPSEPISIANIKLTIRAGDGFQPVVVFRPQPNPLYGLSMVRIAGKQLEASNVHWELDLPRDMSGDWTLFETSRAELLRFEKCSFTVRNPSVGRTAFHPGVAMFDIKAPPGTPGMAMDPTSMDEHVVTIDLQNCVARGEASLVRDNELQPLRLHWDNGLLATSERLLVAAGGSTQPRQLGYIQIRLRHVTAIVQGGLALLTNSEDSPYQLLTEVNATDSILSSTAAAPLVEHAVPTIHRTISLGCSGAASATASTASKCSGRSSTAPRRAVCDNWISTAGSSSGRADRNNLRICRSPGSDFPIRLGHSTNTRRPTTRWTMRWPTIRPPAPRATAPTQVPSSANCPRSRRTNQSTAIARTQTPRAIRPRSGSKYFVLKHDRPPFCRLSFAVKRPS